MTARRHSKKAVDAVAVTVIVLVLVIAANMLSAWWFSYPFLYCALAGTAAYLFIGYGQVAVYIIVLFTLYQFFIRRHLWQALAGCMLLVIINETPRILGHFFAFGGSCG